MSRATYGRACNTCPKTVSNNFNNSRQEAEFKKTDNTDLKGFYEGPEEIPYPLTAI